MDILSHAAAGAATGALFGHPVAGALVAVAPDAVLGVRRKLFPGYAYNVTHGLPFLCVVSLAISLWSMSWAGTVAACLLSHLALDIPTHAETWAPPLLFPFRTTRYSMGNEWEFFNESWWRGFWLTVTWSFMCLNLSFELRIGSLS